MANDVFKDNKNNNTRAASPDISKLPKSLGPRNHTVPDALAAARFLSRSASMPFVSSFSFNTTATGIGNHGTATTTSATTTTSNSNNNRNAEFEPVVSASGAPQRRRLRKEEFEAAEALLFGMGRRGSVESSSSSLCSNNSNNNNSSSNNNNTGGGGDNHHQQPRESSSSVSSSSDDENDDATDGEAENKACFGNRCETEISTNNARRGSWKKRKISDLPSRSEEPESSLSVVSAEEESSSVTSNSINIGV